MNAVSTSRLCTAAIACSVALGSGIDLKAETYTVTDLGSFGGRAEAYAVNDHGVVVGFSRKMIGSSAETRAFEYSGGSLTDLEALPGGLWSWAQDVNNSGVIVGFAETPEGTHAFKYENDTMKDLGTMDTGKYSYAQAINDSGVIVGYGRIHPTAGNQRAFKYVDDTMTKLVTLFGGHTARAYDVNNSGVIVGRSATGSGLNHASRWNTDGSITDLGTFSDSPAGAYSYATGINDLGVIVGYCDTTADHDQPHAFIYQGGTMTNLGTLGGNQSFARAVNDSGIVVGMSEIIPDNYSTQAFMYDGTTLHNLNDLIPQDSDWVLGGAWGINDAGWIVGYGRLPAYNSPRAYLLVPVPEPSLWALLISGISAAVLFGGHRRGS